jgi:phosphoesterase RecJ-like protein
VIISILVRETDQKKIRGSLRSKGTVDVSKIARDFGGGGHVNAAGFKSELSAEQVLSLVLTKIDVYLRRQ